MMRSTLTAALAVLPVALATSWDVSVGPNGQLIYYPEYVLAEVGDTINMIFHPKNHTVTQSSFDAPCVPLAGGVSSGFLPVASDSDPELPNFVITVNDTNPIWIHCEQKGHCGAGMVFAVNPPDASSNHSFAAFQAYTSYSGTPEPTYAAGGPVTHNITVGINGQLAFGPANISAAIGDIVEFTFLAKNHSVVQSSFPEPCTPLVDGFNLGFHPVDANVTGPSFSITINNTSPIWGYCAQTNPVSHCGSGMVFSINAVETGPNNFAAFLALAEATLANSTVKDTSGATASSGSSSPSTELIRCG
ncbi:Cupredoxin [Lentinula edodes]|uniref:Cupredoxin n=1 Tax=Lentinula edodes TaxID=5353 RepID=A0A1Q3E986_LENED|nr:Cupredoxin [Lentinula edodes]